MIERCSERVRSAQLGVIKVLLYETEPAKAEDEQHEGFRANLMRRREHWLTISVQDIVRQYQSELSRVVASLNTNTGGTGRGTPTLFQMCPLGMRGCTKTLGYFASHD